MERHPELELDVDIEVLKALESRWKFFTEKGIETAASHDKVLVSIFTALIGGLAFLVIYKGDVIGEWSGVFFLISVLCSIVGLGLTLVHIALSAKLMFLYAAFYSGEDNLPYPVDGEQCVTEEALVKTRKQTYMCYKHQLAELFYAILTAGIGVAILLWDRVKLAGLIVGGVTVFLFVAVSLARLATALRKK